jgi:ATP-binding cassette, subfamily B, bacterial
MEKYTLPKKLYPFILFFLSKHKLKIVCMFFVSVVLAFDLSIRPYMIKLIIDIVASYNQNMKNLTHVLFFPVLGYLISMLTLTIAFRFYDAIRLSMLPQIQANITSNMLRYVGSHSHNFFQNNMSGEIASQIKEMTLGIKEIIKLSIDKFFAHFLSLFIASITLFTVHPLLCMILIAWTCFFLIITVKLSKQSGQLAEELAKQQNMVHGKIVDSLSNNMSVKLFTKQDQEIKTINLALNSQVQADKNLEWCMLKIRAVQSFSVIIMITLLLIVLIYAKQYGFVTIGDFALTISLSLSISEVIWNISDDFVTFSESVGRCKQALGLIKIEHEIIDKGDAYDIKNLNGEIIFDKVNFAFNDKQKIFNDLSIKIHPKEKIGIIGFSGVGKTTLVNLITRIFDVQSGRILIDGHNIRNITQKSLRQNISFIPQETILFHRSLRENIVYGSEHATENEIYSAAQKAYAHDFIISTEHGYDTIAGDRGIKLSGGQKQRIAIARAFLKNTSILIMDEATSALDSETESCIQDSLQNLMKNKTVIVIAHRLSTLKTMDRILIFDNGQIIADGTHQTLIQISNVYKKLWDAQVGSFVTESQTFTNKIR